MGLFNRQNLGLGVELGQTSGKAVLLEETGGHLQVTHALYLNRHCESFLNEQEMRQAFGDWLLEHDLHQNPAAGNLSQHLTLEAVYEFPPQGHWGNLRKMVEFQTQSLCGITEENFICGAQRLTARKGRKNRILIAASRETVVNASYETMLEAGANVQTMAENGQALANAFISLKPEDFHRNTLQMVLNVDRNNSEFILFRGGALLYVTGLTTSGKIFSNCLMQTMGCDAFQAENAFNAVTPDWEDPSSPFVTALNSLVNEIKTVLKHWKQNGTGLQTTETILTKVWLTGDCAAQNGFAEHMGKLLGCQVLPFGVPADILENSGLSCPRNLDFHPYLTVAYGLALQAMGRSQLTISLIPQILQKKIRHASDFPFLCAAIACLMAVILTCLWAWTESLKQAIKTLENRRDALQQCKVIIPQIERTERNLTRRYQRMLPLLEYGRRNHLFVQAIRNCQTVLLEKKPEKTKARAIYLADEFSFHQEHGLRPILNPGQNISEPRTNILTRITAEKRSSPRDKNTFPDHLNQTQNVCVVDDIPRLKNMFLGGITVQNETRFETLKKIQENFTLENLFANVDDYTDAYRENILGNHAISWRTFLQDKQSQLATPYAVFLLQLPFQEKVSE